MSKVLVTGVSGLVGSAAANLFHDKGWEVVGIDNNMRSHFFGTEKREQANVLNIDIRNWVDIEDLFKEHQFDAIIHAAAQPSHDYATAHVLEDFSVNALGTVQLLEATRQHAPSAIFIYVSTDKVYGENMGNRVKLRELETRYDIEVHPMVEKAFAEGLGLDFAGDRSFFGCSKAAGDMYAQQYAERGMRVAIFRPGCITGKNHAGAEQHGFLAYLAKCIKEGKTYKIFGNGKNVRDQIHANDLAEAFYMTVDDLPSGHFADVPTNPYPLVYNIGGGPERAVSVLEAGEMLSKAIGKPFLHEFHVARKGDRLFDVHDISKFRRDYPQFEYQYDLSAIIRDLIEI